MKNPKTILIVVGTLVLVFVGFLFARGAKPIIEIKAEHPFFSGGPFPIANTYTSSVLAVVVILVLAYLGARKASLIPNRLQNLVEAVFEAGYNLCVSTAGEKHGRRFFPVFMTIFIFVWVANWLALLPFFNALGTVEKVTAEEFRTEANVYSKTAGILVLKPSTKTLEFEVPTGACSGVTGDAHETCLQGAQGQAIVEELHKKDYTTVTGEACAQMPAGAEQSNCYIEASDQALAQMSANGKELGVMAPYFRSMNTDVNSPLSIAIMSAIFVEFWGITTLGFFKYASKFFTLSSPINFFVGILEFIAELARIVSFTFRLFGNMLAGEILLLVMTFLLPFVVAIPFYGLELFVGLIQAFVFAMLTLVFAVLAVSSHDDHGEHEPVEVTALH